MFSLEQNAVGNVGYIIKALTQMSDLRTWIVSDMSDSFKFKKLRLAIWSQ